MRDGAKSQCQESTSPHSAHGKRSTSRQLCGFGQVPHPLCAPGFPSNTKIIITVTSQGCYGGFSPPSALGRRQNEARRKLPTKVPPGGGCPSRWAPRESSIACVPVTSAVKLDPGQAPGPAPSLLPVLTVSPPLLQPEVVGRILPVQRHPLPRGHLLPREHQHHRERRGAGRRHLHRHLPQVRYLRAGLGWGHQDAGRREGRRSQASRWPHSQPFGEVLGRAGPASAFSSLK